MAVETRDIVDLSAMQRMAQIPSDPVEAAYTRRVRTGSQTVPANPNSMDGMRALGFVLDGDFSQARTAAMEIKGASWEFPVQPVLISDRTGLRERQVTMMKPPRAVIRELTGR